MPTGNSSWRHQGLQRSRCFILVILDSAEGVSARLDLPFCACLCVYQKRYSATLFLSCGCSCLTCCVTSWGVPGGRTGRSVCLLSRPWLDWPRWARSLCTFFPTLSISSSSFSCPISYPASYLPFFFFFYMCLQMEISVDVGEEPGVLEAICSYIDYQCSRPPMLHSRDLHSVIVAAFYCLNVWITQHTNLLDQQVPFTS